MFEVTIEPRWSLRLDNGDALSERTIALLCAVAEHGSLLRACAAVGVSYRHAWALIRDGEALLGMPLLLMERGKGSRLSPLSERLVWADRRVTARLSPTLDSLASELEAEIGRVQHEHEQPLRIRASHGFAVEALHHRLNRTGVLNELRYCSSVDAVASLALAIASWRDSISRVGNSSAPRSTTIGPGCRPRRSERSGWPRAASG